MFNQIKPVINITVDDVNSDVITVTWTENTTGSWVARQTNTTVASGSILHYNFSLMDEYHTFYYLKIWLNDGNTNISVWYRFRTLNHNATITNEQPSNESTGISTTPSLNITVSDADADRLIIRWYTNLTSPVLRPDENGSMSEWSPIGPDYGYLACDEIIRDNLTTYIDKLPGNVYRYDLYNLSNITINTFTIHSVTVYCWVIKGARNSYFKTALRTHGNYYYGSEFTASGGWELINKTYTTNPDTSNAWTWTEVQELEAGVGAKTTNDISLPGPRCTQVFVVVNENYSFAQNTSVTNGTYRQMNLNFSEDNTRYYWNVTVNDGYSMSFSDWYMFTTASSGTVIDEIMHLLQGSQLVWLVVGGCVSVLLGVVLFNGMVRGRKRKGEVV